ncbi:hypothetical protein GOODEAATRI_028264 [Goodea atripinnis]|uniref:Uncharacterized protein n=1 Tax=Goodea atripinnis TaxID=208336 RepID=A0ABV0MVT6_9TELE
MVFTRKKVWLLPAKTAANWGKVLKDIQRLLAELASCVDIWYIPTICPHIRALSHTNGCYEAFPRLDTAQHLFLKIISACQRSTVNCLVVVIYFTAPFTF